LCQNHKSAHLMTENIRMQGIWLENQTIRFRSDLPVPVPSDGEALIKVLLAGICGTDVQLLKGYYPFTGIPGHEFVGQVVEAPAAPQLIGKRVVGEINVGCGLCGLCRQGLDRHCEKRSVLGIKHRHGAFCEYLTLPVTNLHVVPKNVCNDKAVFTEPTAAAARILEQLALTPTTSVLVIGAGRLGLLIAQVINATGCRVRVVAKHEQQRRLLNDFAIPFITEEQAAISEADVVIEASGRAAGLHAAMQAVKPTGVIVLKSTYAGDTQFDFSRLVVNEITVIGSRCGPFEPALKLLQLSRVDPVPLIRARFPFSRATEAFATAMQPGGLKVLLYPE